VDRFAATDRVITSCNVRLSEHVFRPRHKYNSGHPVLSLLLVCCSLGYSCAGQVDVAQTSCLLVQVMAVKLWITTPVDVHQMVMEFLLYCQFSYYYSTAPFNVK
jgi:hypothetical protein